MSYKILYISNCDYFRFYTFSNCYRKMRVTIYTFANKISLRHYFFKSQFDTHKNNTLSTIVTFRFILSRMVTLFRFIQVKTVHTCIWLTSDGIITDLSLRTFQISNSIPVSWWVIKLLLWMIIDHISTIYRPYIDHISTIHRPIK